jgi:hypothetical protein
MNFCSIYINVVIIMIILIQDFLLAIIPHILDIE